MSSGTKVPFEHAFALATEVAKELQPHVGRIKAAGSLRRRAPEVSDLEFVLEPLQVPVDLFGALGPDIDGVRAAALRMGTLSKNGERYIRIDHVLGSELDCDLFLVWPPAQWGSILAIRTGPAALSTWAVGQMRRWGLRHIDGHVETERGELVPTPTEEDFFAAARLPCLRPQFRHTQAAYRTLQEGGAAAAGGAKVFACFRPDRRGS